MVRQFRLASFLTSGNLKSHHYHLIRWFKTYSIKYIEDSDASSADSAAEEEITQGPHNEAPFDSEVAVQKKIDAAAELAPTFTRRQWFHYQNWLEEQDMVKRLHRIIGAFDPPNNKLDTLALARIRGKPLVEFAEGEVDSSTTQFKQMLDNNLDLLAKKDAKYKFLHKVNARTEANAAAASQAVVDEENSKLGV